MMYQKYLTFIVIALIIFSCSEVPTKSEPQDFSNDYFPFTSDYTWTYKTNAFSRYGETFVSFETRIDKFNYNTGVFWAWLDKIEGTTEWQPNFALKDSGNVVYSLGDYPPEGNFPLFKHHYDENEGTRETITVNGITYETVRIDLNIDEGKLTMWFAKGIGLVKESSENGISLFNDDHLYSSIFLQTELIQLKK